MVHMPSKCSVHRREGSLHLLCVVLCSALLFLAFICASFCAYASSFQQIFCFNFVRTNCPLFSHFVKH